jgi:hypothetical protein
MQPDGGNAPEHGAWIAIGDYRCAAMAVIAVIAVSAVAETEATSAVT